jgi:hypothetical protein
MARGDLAEAAIYAGNGLLWNERNARLECYLSVVEDKRGDFPAASRAARRALAIDASDKHRAPPGAKGMPGRHPRRARRAPRHRSHAGLDRAGVMLYRAHALVAGTV